jgi:hypothetical protein
MVVETYRRTTGEVGNTEHATGPGDTKHFFLRQSSAPSFGEEECEPVDKSRSTL